MLPTPPATTIPLPMTVTAMSMAGVEGEHLHHLPVAGNRTVTDGLVVVTTARKHNDRAGHRCEGTTPRHKPDRSHQRAHR